MNILVIEDDKRIASFLERGLRAEGHNVALEFDGRNGLEHALTELFELIILDVNLPYVDGYEISSMLRKQRRPSLVLMLTARDGLEDKIKGLRGGADDYLTKPFAFDELLARMVAMQRRSQPASDDGVLSVADLTLYPDSHRVTLAGRPIELTVREFELLRYLMANAGKVISRQRLLNSVWDYGYDPGTKIVDVYVRYVRKKIDVSGQASLIQTVRGVGYMMAADGAETGSLSPNSNRPLNGL